MYLLCVFLLGREYANLLFGHLSFLVLECVRDVFYLKIVAPRRFYNPRTQVTQCNRMQKYNIEMMFVLSHNYRLLKA
jgi:hypothetical protein